MFPSSVFSVLLLIIYPTVTVLVFGASFGSSSAIRNCSDAQLSKCISTDNINKFRLIANEEEFDNLCGVDISERLRCIDNYTRNCMDSEQRSHFNKIYSESTMVIQEFCVDGGEYRKEFLKHSPCLKNNRDAHEACSANYSKSLEDIKNNAIAGIASPHIKNVCCSLQEYIRCSKDSVKAACGEETARFAGGFLDRMVSGLVENHCQNFRIVDGKCSDSEIKNGATSYGPPMLFFLLPFLITFFTTKF